MASAAKVFVWISLILTLRSGFGFAI